MIQHEVRIRWFDEMDGSPDYVRQDGVNGESVISPARQVVVSAARAASSLAAMPAMVSSAKYDVVVANRHSVRERQRRPFRHNHLAVDVNAMNLEHRLRRIGTDERRGHRTISVMRGIYPSDGASRTRQAVHLHHAANGSCCHPAAP
jgi:hypothetical protein